MKCLFNTEERFEIRRCRNLLCTMRSRSDSGRPSAKMVAKMFHKLAVSIVSIIANGKLPEDRKIQLKDVLNILRIPD